MLQQLSSYLQNICHQSISPALNHAELSSGFLCGTSLTNPHTQGLLLNSGLIHLIVVSGAHLQLLLSFIEFVLPKKWQQGLLYQIVIISFLIFYSLSTGFQPPIVRALFLWLLQQFSSVFHLHFSKNKSAITSGIICLILFPDWIHNFSFFLSWIVSLTLCLPHSNNHKPTLWQKALLFFLQNLLIQILLIIPLGTFSITGLICNFILAPILSIFLFPISITATLPLPVAILSDVGWQWCLNTIHYLSHLVQFAQDELLSQSQSFNFNPNWMRFWFFLAFIHFSIEMINFYRFQKQKN